MVVLEFVLPLSVRNPVLSVVGVSGLTVMTFVVWRSAYRWDRERDEEAAHD
jgi:hypothetical protein